MDGDLAHRVRDHEYSLPEEALAGFARAWPTAGIAAGVGRGQRACRPVSPPIGLLTVLATAGTPGGGSTPCGRGDGEVIRCRPGGDEADPSVRRLLAERGTA